MIAKGALLSKVCPACVVDNHVINKKDYRSCTVKDVRLTIKVIVYDRCISKHKKLPELLHVYVYRANCV